MNGVISTARELPPLIQSSVTPFINVAAGRAVTLSSMLEPLAPIEKIQVLKSPSIKQSEGRHQINEWLVFVFLSVQPGMIFVHLSLCANHIASRAPQKIVFFSSARGSPAWTTAWMQEVEQCRTQLPRTAVYKPHMRI